MKRLYSPMADLRSADIGGNNFGTQNGEGGGLQTKKWCSTKAREKVNSTTLTELMQKNDK